MKKALFAAAAVVLVGTGAAIATAQTPPPPPGDGPGGGPGGRRMTMMDGAGRPPGPGGMHRFPPPSKAAFFRLRRGDAEITVKCADDEPMKACVDAASQLLDKAAATK